MYRYAGRTARWHADEGPGHGAVWSPFTAELIVELFGHDRKRMQTFRRMHDQGFEGGVFHSGSSWFGYHWMATPHSPQPEHLPNWVRDMGVCWLLRGHTREDLRGRGIYKQVLSRMVRHAQSRYAGVDIYHDSYPEVVASRKAAASVGFVPAGEMEILSWSLLGRLRVNRGRWKRDDVRERGHRG